MIRRPRRFREYRMLLRDIISVNLNLQHEHENLCFHALCISRESMIIENEKMEKTSLNYIHQ